MGILILPVAFTGIFGFLIGAGIMGIAYFLSGGRLLSEAALMLMLAPPSAVGFAFSYRPSKPLPEAYAFVGMMLLAEAIALTLLAPFWATLLGVGILCAVGALVGLVVRVMHINIEVIWPKKTSV